MTEAERIIRVKVLLMNDETATDAVVREYLSAAKDDVLEELYAVVGHIPEDVDDVPPMYHSLQCELAARYFARRGGLGETVHLENGIHRHYASTEDREILNRIIPYARVR